MDYYKNADKWPCITVSSNKGMTVEVVDDLEEEPVTLAEAKAYLQIDSTDHDAVLPGIITAARQMLEKYSGWSFGEKTLKLYLDEFNDKRMTLPYGPVVAVTEVSVDDEAQTIDEGYELTANNKIKILTGYKDLVVTYTTKSTAQGWMKNAVLAQVAKMFEHKGDEEGKALSDLAEILIGPHMILNVF